MAPRLRSAYSRMRRRSNRSLIAPPKRRHAIVGTVIAIPTIESAAGVFQSEYAVHAIATRKTPSPTSDTVMPAQSRRKSRDLSGRSKPTRATPPGRSRPSKLCCIGVELRGDRLGVVRQVVVERPVRHRASEDEALAEGEPEPLERIDLVTLLDTLGDHL